MEELSNGIRRALAEAAGMALAPAAERAACCAAWLNALRDDDYHVSFSALLLGLRLLGGDDWFAQQCEATFGPPPRMLATLFGGRLGERTLDTALACVDADRWPDEDWPNSREPPPVEGVPWPRRAGRGEVSASAARLLRYAGNRARSRDGAAIEVLDLIAAYVLDAHGHERQLESYGFELQALRAAFAGYEAAAAATAPPAAPTAIAGADHPLVRLRCDDDARYVLRHAANLALGARQHAPPILTLRQILYALLEAGDDDGPVAGARALRSALGDAYRPGLGDEVAASGTQPDWPPAPFAAGETLPMIYPELASVFERAARWAGDEAVDLPALALALASEASEAAGRAFKPLLPLNQIEIRERWRDALHAEAAARGADPARYERWLYGEPEAAPAGVLPDLARPARAGDDCLGVGRYALALAATAIARATAPPLAIGVFGDWGAGKSYFMGLMELEMHALAAGSDERFHRHVLPVWFNAWHYADANLWASLMQALLEKIAGHLSAGPSQDTAPDFTALLRQLDAAGSGAALARTGLAAAQRAADEAKKQFDAASDQVHAEERAVQTRLADVFQELVSGQSGQSLGQRLGDELEALGFGTLAGAARDAGNRYDAILATAGQAETLTADARSLWLALRQWRWTDVWLLIAMAAGSAGIVGILHSDTVSQALGTATVTTGALAAALGWLRQRFAAVARLREHLTEIRQRQAEAAASAALGEPAKAAEAAQRNLEAARQRLDTALAARQQAASALSESFVSARIASFVEQRLKSGLYREQLSLVSTIRRDLDTITRYLQQRSAAHRQQEAAAYQQLAGTGTDPSVPPPLDRIVLYIDDLDRCPPERVVEVLEAVHLLLALPLFVVVVGVDVRWVSAALCRRYRGLLVGERDRLGEARMHPTATPTDYLEKIFQIPFRLPAIDAVPARRLLGTLTGTRQPSATRPESGTGKPVMSASTRPDASIPSVPVTGAQTDDAQTPAVPGAGDGADSVAVTPTLTVNTTTDDVSADIRFTVGVALDIGPDEAAFMARLLDALGGSPRRVRRYVNSYRVYKAALRPAERDELLAGGGYREVLAALALQIGLGHRLAEVRQAAGARPGGGDEPRAWLAACRLDAAHEKRIVCVLDALKTADEPADAECRRLLHLLGRPDIARFSFAPAVR